MQIRTQFKLVKGYKNRDPVIVDLLNHYEFHILPIGNKFYFIFNFNLKI